MEINDLINTYLTNTFIGNFFMKSFAIVFSLLFLVFVFIAQKQVEGINKMIINKRNIYIITWMRIQVGVGVGLLLYAILFI